MTKSILSNSLISLSILSAGVLIGFALIASGAMSVKANSIDDIIYPVAELGGCENKSECKSYCDDIEHMDECIAFAEGHNLMSKREIKDAKEFARIGIRKGPGSCTTHAECESYCENINNIEECLAFAERHNMIPKEELKEARQIAKALREGAELPGGCTSKQSCENYCEDSAHIEECVLFAEKAGFMSPEELREVRRILPLMKSGQMPGGCTSKEQCEAYCEDDNNIMECVTFAEKAGFMSPEEAAMARKTGGKGPGGCRRDECDAYCEDINHQDECFAFAKEHGLISEEDLAHMKEGAQRIRQGLEHASPEVISCLKEKVGPNIINEIENGTFSPSRRSGEDIRICFEQFMTRPDFSPGIEHGDDDFIRGRFEEERKRIEGGILNFPPQASECLIKLYGPDYNQRIMSGEINPNDVQNVIKECMERSIETQLRQTSSAFEAVKHFLHR